MICGKNNRSFFYCHRCRWNPDNLPWSDVWHSDLTYPRIEPISGDCLDFEDDTEPANEKA